MYSTSLGWHTIRKKVFDKVPTWFQRAASQNNVDAKAKIATYYLGFTSVLLNYQLTMELSMQVSDSLIIYQRRYGLVYTPHVIYNQLVCSSFNSFHKENTSENNINNLYYDSDTISAKHWEI
jgi:hypothetical protein